MTAAPVVPHVTGQYHLRRVERDVRAGIFAPTPSLTESEWAEAHRYISVEHNPEEPGPWRNARVPYLTEIMDALSHPRIERVIFKKASRVGGTECLNNFVGYVIDQRPRPTIVVLPTIEEAEGWSKETLDPMLRDTPRLRGRVRDSDSGRRQKGSTIKYKAFPGGYLVIVGSNAAAGLRRRSIANVLMSEVDGFGFEARGGRAREGDPVNLAIRRSHNVRSRKIYMESTPTEKGRSRIAREYEQSDQREFYVPCPHCGYMQTLKWANLEWEEKDPHSVVYVCGDYDRKEDGSVELLGGCGAAIQEHHKPWMLERGEWRPRRPERGIRGYFIWSGYSPLVTWSRLVEEWLAAQGDPMLLKTFINTVLGEEWEDVETELDPKTLAARRAKYLDADREPVEVPMGVGLLTAGVDVQGDRLEASVFGWGAGEELWVIWHEVLIGNPTESDVWDRLSLLRGRRWNHTSGTQLTIACTCVDSGYQADAVYNYAAAHVRANVFATKGVSTPGAAPIGKMKKLEAGGRFFPLGTDTLKDSLFGRFAVETPGPRYVHFPWSLPDEYFEQLTSEQRRLRYVNRRPVYRWELRQGRRNEALDCAVYAIAALYILGPTARASLSTYAERAQEGKPPTPAAGRRGRGRRVRSRGVQ